MGGEGNGRETERKGREDREGNGGKGSPIGESGSANDTLGVSLPAHSVLLSIKDWFSKDKDRYTDLRSEDEEDKDLRQKNEDN